MRTVFYLFLASIAANTAWLVGPLDWRVAPALLVGWYLADFASGAVHMYMDYRPCPPGRGLDGLFFYDGSRESEDYLLLRAAAMARINAFERLVFDFKNHHPRPSALGRRSLWRLVGSTVIFGALPGSLLLNLAHLFWPVPAWLTAGALAMLLGGAFSQYFHSTLHRERAPAFVALLRRTGLLMTPAAHQRHHDSLKRDFATNSGWSNGVLNVVFRLLYDRGLLTDAGLEPS